MKRVRTADRGRAALGHHVGDPVRGVGGHVRDLRTPLGAQRVEKPAQRLRVAARRGPHQPATVVVDHHRQVVVVALVGDLIDTDSPQIREPVDALFGVGPDPGHDRPHGAPGDPHQLAHRGFRARHRQPGHRVIEGQGVPGMITRPRHRHHGRPMRGQFTRGASASSTTCTVPQSRPRQRRRPSPRSYQGALRPQRPHRRETPRPGRTRATTSWAPSAPSSSNSMSSITVRLSTPNSPRHNLTLRTSLPAPLFLTRDKPETLSDNDVRPLTIARNPRMCQRAIFWLLSLRMS